MSHEWEGPGSSAETGTDTSNQVSTCTTEFNNWSRQVSWWDVHEFVTGWLQCVGEFPMAGTRAWCSLTDNDPRKLAALLDAARHWALRVETCQEAECQASRDISAAADWSGIAQKIRQLNDFRATRPWARRMVS
ncbi:MAG: DUF2742 domain-containing protein [Mycobacterium sp.]|uniref:DUF2742 domain-containing protein n=1 Tax=Mycobacterium sp. TaxID=1785 RepID=UPI003F999069